MYKWVGSFPVQVQLAKAAMYTDCLPAKGWVSPNECPAYDTKQADSEGTVKLERWGM